jgi:hypothetical protein
MTTVAVSADIRWPVTLAGAVGTVTFQLMQPLVDGGTVYGTNVTLTETVEAGDFPAPVNLQAGAVWEVTVQTDAWREQFEVYVAATPSSITLAALFQLAQPAPSAPAQFVPTTLLGALNGVATLGADGVLIESQRPLLWQLAERYAGLSNPSAIVPYSGNDPNNAITLASGTYQNLLFHCSELIIPNNDTKLVNCDIVCTNSNFSVRLDANTGLETGRYLEHCRITGPGAALAGAGFRARLCEVYHTGDDSARLGRSHAEPTVFELCHFHDYMPAANAHCDGIQIVTYPAADVVVLGCSITLTTAPGYVRPGGAGYTGALFVDTADVPIGGSDPEPARRGGIWAVGCKFVAEDNYSVVIDGPNTDIRDCTLLPGSTAVESIQAGVTVTGGNNSDLNGVPLVDTDIGGTPITRFLTVGDPRQTGGGGGATTFAALTDVLLTSLADGQVPTWSASASKWENKTPASGGGAGPAMSIVSGQLTSGNVAATNTAGAFLPIAGTSVSISAALGDQVSGQYGFTDASGAGSYYDIGVTVGGVLVRQLYSPAFPATSSYEGMPGALPDNPPAFFGPVAPRWFTVTSGDLDSGGVVTFCLCRRSTGSGSLLMSADIPVTYSLYNNHH